MPSLTCEVPGFSSKHLGLHIGADLLDHLMVCGGAVAKGQLRPNPPNLMSIWHTAFAPKSKHKTLFNWPAVSFRNCSEWPASLGKDLPPLLSVLLLCCGPAIRVELSQCRVLCCTLVWQQGNACSFCSKSKENPTCVDCAAGKFQPLESAAPCSDCLAGPHASN